jgi:hypothetical protein
MVTEESLPMSGCPLGIQLKTYTSIAMGEEYDSASAADPHDD